MIEIGLIRRLSLFTDHSTMVTNPIAIITQVDASGIGLDGGGTGGGSGIGSSM
jgi:hypothetical protein